MAERQDQLKKEELGAAEVDSESTAELASSETEPAPEKYSESGGTDRVMAADYLEDEYSSEEYESMLDMYEQTLKHIDEGEIVKASVLRVTDNAVILDVGFKSEGSVPKEEFKDPDELKQGDEVDVFLESLEDQDGVVVLSKKKADFFRVWEKIKDAYENDQKVPGTLVRKIKGGLTVDIMGVDAFLPGSQIALRRVPNVEELLGQTFNFKIIKLNKRRRNIVVSRRVILEQEREHKRDQLVKELLVNQVRRGVVKNVTDFGAFIDLGGLDGLLHITDMSWGRVGHPSELVHIGDELDVKVLDVDWERERISLGLKQLLSYPWKDVERKYPMGVRVRGRVVSITNYGAFVELEKGVEGLVHISEMSWTRNVKHPSKLVSIGDEIEAVVLKVDRDEEKISLGMKQIEEDPWLALPVKYPTGTRIKGKVRNLTSFGAFVEIEPGIDGLIHISDMSWTKRVQHPSEVLRKGEDVEVVVLGVDAENKRISLGFKQTEDDPWNRLVDRFAPETEVDGTVVRVVDEGVVVDLGDDIEGFVPVSQLGIKGAKDPAEYLKEGQGLELRVLESDPVNRRIVLTVTSIPEPVKGDEDTEDAASEAPGETEADAGAESEAPGETEAGAGAEAGTDGTAPEKEQQEETGPEAGEEGQETVDAGSQSESGSAESEAVPEPTAEGPGKQVDAETEADTEPEEDALPETKKED